MKMRTIQKEQLRNNLNNRNINLKSLSQMKRVLLTVALCVAASASFAQKKVVNEAQSIAKGSNADFGEARTLIKGALENPETKDDAKTWYVAGFIEDQQLTPKELNKSWDSNLTNRLCTKPCMAFYLISRKPTNWISCLMKKVK